MRDAPWGSLLVKPMLIVAGVALATGWLLGQCARLPDPPDVPTTQQVGPVADAPREWKDPYADPSYRPQPSPEVSLEEVLACWNGRSAKMDGDFFGAMVRTDCRWGSVYRQDYESEDEGLRVFERGREDAMPVFDTGDDRELAAIRKAIKGALARNPEQQP